LRYIKVIHAQRLIVTAKRRPIMKTFHVDFFKNLLSSDGHQYKCLQKSLDVTGEDAGDALLSAKRQFEQLTRSTNWTHRADFAEIQEGPDCC
jgi:hypothetical protein